MQRSPARNDELVRDLQRALSQADFGLRGVPNMLVVVLRDGSWRERTIRETGEVVRFARFAEFVTAPPLRGLGATVRQLQRLCEDDPEAKDRLDAAIQERRGKRPTPDKGVNHPNKQDRSGKQLRRLRKDFPDEHAAVLGGHASVNGAAVRAGVYPRRLSINLDNAASAARSIRARASAAFIAALAVELGRVEEDA